MTNPATRLSRNAIDQVRVERNFRRFNGVLGVEQGGTAADNATDALTNIGGAAAVHGAQHVGTGTDPIPVATAAAAGLLLALGAGTSKFLREDGSWQTVTAGSGCNLKVGTYTGDATNPHAITGVGFQPKFVVVATVDTGDAPRMRIDGSTVTKSFNGGNESGIASLDADGFTLTDANAVNRAGDTFIYLCLG